MSSADLTPEELAQQIAALQAQLVAMQAQKPSAHAETDSGTIVQGEKNQVAEDGGINVGRGVKGSIITGNNNSVTQIRHIYQGAPGQAALSETSFNDALGRYLNWVAQRYSDLNLRGVEKREQQALSLTLDDVYVSLAAVVSRDRKAQRPAKDQPDAARAAPIDMGKLLPLSPRLVITGGPGSGKTTYLHLIASSLAHAIRSNKTEAVAQHLGLQAPLPLPILVSLSSFNRYRRSFDQPDDPRQGTLIAFI
ncbi:MAG: hypothetical protein GY952_15760, partial [Rhodobacteraceae bacterium]|nr:hypothetical protein [Paracoccaceae bacterium]